MIKVLVALAFGAIAFPTSIKHPTAIAPTYKTYVLAPVDEASKEPSFEEFRKKLIHALENKDVAFVSAILAKSISFSFGNHGYGDGPEGFKRMWKLNKNPEKSDLWKILLKIVNNGGTFSQDHTSFVAPYIWAAWPHEKFPSYSFVAVNAKDVKVMGKPSDSSAPLQTISYEIVRLIDRGSKKPEGWAEIKLPDGQRAYIQNRYLESAIGYRAQFDWNDKEWKMTTFIAGE